MKLEIQLSTSHLARDKEGFLKDSITQRLLFIRFRDTHTTKFEEICKAGIAFYRQRLSTPYPHAASDAVEYLYLCIHEACHVRNKCEDDLKSIITQQLEQIVKWFEQVWGIENAKSLIFQFAQELTEDWELAFLANYFLDPRHYRPTLFCEIVTDFNCKHPLYTTGEAT